MGHERLGTWPKCGEQSDVVLVHYGRPVGVWIELLLDGEDVLPDCMSGYGVILS